VIVLIGLMLALVALVVIAAPGMEKAAEKAVP